MRKLLPTSCPKPRKNKVKKLKFSSIKKRGSKIAKVNPERQKKAAKRARSKHAKYMASETRKIVDARADGRCEALVIHRATERGVFPFSRIAGAVLPGERVPMRIPDPLSRCAETEKLEHHHRTYVRYGGAERPEDVALICKAHHDYFESLKPAGNRRSRSRQVA